MSKLPRRWQMVFSAAGGLAGFLVFLIARAIALVVALRAMSIFGSSSLSGSQTLILFGLVPLLLILGAGITAWFLGASLWRGFLAGVIALSVFAVLETGQPNYSPFNAHETLAFICAAFITVMISVWGRGRSIGLVALLGLALAWVGLGLILPGSGFTVSLLAWLTLPLVTIFAQAGGTGLSGSGEKESS